MIRGFDRHGVRTIHAWGMTEMTPLGSAAVLKPSMDALDEDTRYAYRARQGPAMSFVDMRLVNDAGVVPWDGETMGEVQVRGPWIAAAYHDSGELGDKWTEDGWLRTGDVGTIDTHGFMKITDRTKDLIKSGGEWISSVDLENALMGHPAVSEAAVIAVRHAKWDERARRRRAQGGGGSGRRRADTPTSPPASPSGGCPTTTSSSTRSRARPPANSSSRRCASATRTACSRSEAQAAEASPRSLSSQ